jgi:F-type H+-transporting ATPase subunit b
MAAAETTGTQAPTGFPPFKTETFPSQLFWLTLTFTFLFFVMWRVAGPRIGSVIAERQARIDKDLGDAEKHRRDTEKASAAYEAALDQARQKAQNLADDNRKRIAAEVDRAKAQADAEARRATAAAEARLATVRAEATGHVAKTAQEAAIAIVWRLTGDTVSAEDAAAALNSASRS